MWDGYGKRRFRVGFWRGVMLGNGRIGALWFLASLARTTIRVVALSTFSGVRIRGITTIGDERDTG
jgi:hypothetical protein